MDGTRSALIVASEQYTDPGLQRLRAPASDARALAGVLRDPAIGGFDVRTLLNEPAHVVNLAVEEFFADRQPADLLLMHFSGHGIKDQDGELYFAASDTVMGRLAATAVAAEFVNRRMSRSRSRRVVLLLDCCYAGAFERGLVARSGADLGIEQQLGGRGRAVITASSAMEYAFEAGELTGELTGTSNAPPSVFTSALVQGLATGDADRDQNGLVGLNELYDYVYDQVRAATPSQTPGKWTFGMEGELYIARRARPVSTPAPLQAELQQAIDSPLAGIRAGAVQELAALLGGSHAGRALAARLALEQLTRDDSRAVAAAATAALAQPAAAAFAQPAPAAKAAPPPAAAPPRDDHPPGPRPRSDGRRRAAIMAGAVAVLAAAAVVLSIFLFSGKPPSSSTSTPPPPPKAGTQAWKFATRGQIWSSPAVANGIVYFGSFDDYVYALNAKSGTVLWRQKTGGEVQSSPVVVDGVVYIGSDDGKLYALHAAATPGKQVIWSQPIGGQVVSSPAVSSNGSTVYVGSSNYLYALLTSPRVSSHVAWRVPTGGMIRSGPVVAGNVIYVGSESGGLYAVRADGSVKWNYSAAGFVDSNPTVTVAGGVVYFGNHDGDVYAINATTGNLLWQYHVTTGRADARPVVADNVVYIGTDSGLYAIKPGGPSSFSALWHNPADNLVVSGPAVAGGVLYVGTGNGPGAGAGTLYALNALTGHTNWRHTIGPAIFSSPVVSGNMIFIGSEDDDLYAFYTGS